MGGGLVNELTFEGGNDLLPRLGKKGEQKVRQKSGKK